MPAFQRNQAAAGRSQSMMTDLTLLAALVDAAQTGLVALDDQERIVCVNPAFLAWAAPPALSDPTGRGFAEAFPGLIRQAADASEASGSGLRWLPGPGHGWIGCVQAVGDGAQATPLDALTGLGGRTELGVAFAALLESGAVGRDEVVYLALDLDRAVGRAAGHAGARGPGLGPARHRATRPHRRATALEPLGPGLAEAAGAGGAAAL